MDILREAIQTLINLEIRRLHEEIQEAKKAGDVDVVRIIGCYIKELEGLLRKIDSLKIFQAGSGNPLKPIERLS